MDVDNIPAGVDFAADLNNQVTACRVFLAVIGPNWLDAKDESGVRRLDNPDDFVTIEIAAALARGDIRVIPVLVDNARMPKADKLPESIKPLVRRNAVELRNSQFRRDAEMLVARMREALVPTRSVAPGQEAAGPGKWRVPVVVVVAVALLLLIGGGYAFIQKRAATEMQQVAAVKAEQDRQARLAAEAEAKRKAEEAEQQRAGSTQVREREQDTPKARAGRPEAEAKRKADEAEQQRLAAAKAEQERQARAAEAEAKRKAEEAERQRLAAAKAEQERQARAAEAEAKRKAEEAERQRLAAAKAEQERQARAAEAEAKRKADEAEQKRVAAVKAEQDRQERLAAEAEAKRKAAGEKIAPASVPFISEPTRREIANEYVRMSAYKAFALNIGGVVGYSFRQPSEDAAKTLALDQCWRRAQNALSPRKCELYAVGNTVVYPHPPPMPRAPWVRHDAATERPFVTKDMPLVHDQTRERLEKSYLSARKPKSIAIGPGGQFSSHSGSESIVGVDPPKSGNLWRAGPRALHDRGRRRRLRRDSPEVDECYWPFLRRVQSIDRRRCTRRLGAQAQPSLNRLERGRSRYVRPSGPGAESRF